MIAIAILYTGDIYSQCEAPESLPYLVCYGQQTTIYAISLDGNVTGHIWYTDSIGYSTLPSGDITYYGDDPYTTGYTHAFTSNIKYYVSSVCGWDESSRTPISVTVNPSVTPVVSILPVEVLPGFEGDNMYVNICDGTDFTIKAYPANGGLNPDYQWYSDGDPLTGQTDSLLTLSSWPDNENITVVMTSHATCKTASTATSEGIEIHVDDTIPQISISPDAGPVVGPTLEVTFTSEVTDPGAYPIYQWKKNGNIVYTSASSSYTGSTWSNGDEITCTVTRDEGCSATSDLYTLTADPLFDQDRNFRLW